MKRHNQDKNNNYSNVNSVFFATFSHYQNNKRLPTNGFVEPIISYFLPRTKKLLLLDGPHPVSDAVDPIIEVYDDGKLVKKVKIQPILYLPIYLLCKIPSKKDTRISYKIRDFVATLYTSVFVNTADLFIGVEGIYALAGILLKKIGRVKTVVYYVSDYSPSRYTQPFMNKLYLWLDTFCVKHSDFTWDVSPFMKEVRIEYGLSKQYISKILTVQNGLFPSQINPLAINKRNRDAIVYMGILNEDMGIDMTIEALAIIQKKRPQASLHIIGGTKEAQKRIRKIAQKNKVEQSIVLYGFLPPDKSMASIVRTCSIGVAPYRTYQATRRRCGDPGKIRQYLGCGLPVVTTDFLWYSSYIIKQGAGLACVDSPAGLARSILRLMENKMLYKTASEKAISLSRDNTWDNSYSRALQIMQSSHELKS